MSSANASPAEGPPTPPRSISTSSGSSMSADCSTWTPMIGRPFSSGLSIVPTSPGAWSAAARGPSRPSRRLVLRDQPAEVVRRLHRLAVDADDHVGGLELAVGGRVGGDRDDERALGLGLDVVAELAERDRGRDLLRAVHLAQVLAAAVVEARARRARARARDEVGAVGAEGDTSSSSSVPCADDHVDVVDPARRVRLLALDLTTVRERLGAVGQDEVAVDGSDPERAGDERAEASPAGISRLTADQPAPQESGPPSTRSSRR